VAPFPAGFGTAGSGRPGGFRFAVSWLGAKRLCGSRLDMDPFGADEDALGRADQLVGPVSRLLEPLQDLLDPVLQPVGRVPLLRPVRAGGAGPVPMRRPGRPGRLWRTRRAG
jgi:hypothetical protein